MTTISDDFNRTNSTTTVNPASDGGTWTIVPSSLGTAVWGIDSNQAYLFSGSAGTDMLARDLGAVAADVSIDVTSGASAPNLTASPVALAWDGGDFQSGTGTAYTLRPTPGGNLFVDRWDAGVGSTLDHWGIADWHGATKTFRLVYDGIDTFKVYVDGALSRTVVDTSPLPSPGTHVGFGGDANTMHAAFDYRWDNFTAVPVTTDRGWVVGAITLN